MLHALASRYNMLPQKRKNKWWFLHTKGCLEIIWWGKNIQYCMMSLECKGFEHDEVFDAQEYKGFGMLKDLVLKNARVWRCLKNSVLKNAKVWARIWCLENTRFQASSKSEPHTHKNLMPKHARVLACPKNLMPQECPWVWAQPKVLMPQEWKALL